MPAPVHAVGIDATTDPGAQARHRQRRGPVEGFSVDRHRNVLTAARDPDLVERARFLACAELVDGNRRADRTVEHGEIAPAISPHRKIARTW